MAYERWRRRTLMWGGLSAGAVLLTDTWEWDGSNWKNVTPAGPAPSGRDLTSMANDDVRDNVVLYGGRTALGTNGDTWLWDGTAWMHVFPAHSPPALKGHAMAWDDRCGCVVLFGGIDGAGTVRSDTWLWNGTDWTQVFPASHPSARSEHIFAAVPVLDNEVVFGGVESGGSYPTDTWIWTGDVLDWLNVVPTSSTPTGRVGAQAAGVSDCGAAVMFGGVDSGSIDLGDTCEWRGFAPYDWSDLVLAGPPTTVRGAMAADPLPVYVPLSDVWANGAVLFGGLLAGAVISGQTWFYTCDPDVGVPVFAAPHPFKAA